MKNQSRLAPAILAMCVLSACSTSTAPTYMGHHVYDMTIQVADGQTVLAKITNAGPIPAENDYFKIEVAGFIVGPSKENAKSAVLTWWFSLTSKTGLQIDQVNVVEVFPSKTEKLLLKDSSPTLNERNSWSGIASPLEANSTSTPWLYENRASLYVFKFVIKPLNQPAVVLYQPALFSQAAKEKFRQQIDFITSSK